MGSNGTGGTEFPQSTQGRFATNLGTCSATLFDNRLIVFAAHCWFSYPNNNGPGTWGSNPTFQAGRSSGSTPYGTVGPDPSYTGSVWTAFLDNDCHKTYDNSICPPLDISWMALASTPQDSGGVTAGAMGYDPTLPSGHDYYLAGYPICGAPESPSPCGTTLYYARSGGCSRTSITSSTFETNCAGSYGQSGGPFFYYNVWPTDPRLTGVYAGQKCDGSMGHSCSGISEPNILHRLTMDDYNFMVSLSSMY